MAQRNGPSMPDEPSVKTVQLFEVPSGGGDQQSRQLVTPARAGSSSQCRATRSRVCLMLRALDAPNTIAATLGCAQTHSMASSGGTAPDAKTDIAIARNRRSRKRRLVGLQAAAHAEADLVDVRANDRVLDALLVQHRQQRRQVHRDEAGLSVVAAPHVLREDPERVLESEAEQQVDDDVLQEDHRRAQAVEHLHLGVDQQRRDALDVLLGHRGAAADRGVEQPLVGQEPLERAEHAVLGDRVGVLVGVRHARIEREVRVAIGVRPHVIADRGHPVVRRAHERAHAGVVGGIEDVDHGVERLEAHRLGARLLLRHVVDAEELVVAEEQAIHQEPFRASRLTDGARRRLWDEPRDAEAPAALRRATARFARARASVDAPLWASAIIIAITRSVSAALSNALRPSTLAVPNALDEVIDLRAVLLATQVEADRLGQLRRVADVPSGLVALGDGRGVAQVDLDLLAVGEDPPGRAPDRDSGGHLPVGLVGPVDRDARALAVVVEQRAVHLVVDLAREDRVQDGAADADRLAEVPVQEVQRVRGVVVQGSAALLLAAAPRAALGLENYRSVRLAEAVRDGADRARVEQTS